jgi:hypothetical protein
MHFYFVVQTNSILQRKDNDTIRAIRRAQDESADRHDMFQDALARSHDKFGTISEFFGRGVMDVPTVD